MTTRSLALLFGKWMLLTVLFTICFITATLISGLAASNPESGDQPTSLSFLVLLANSAITVGLLGWIVLRSNWLKWQEMLGLFAILFVIGTFLPQLDSLFFSNPLGMDQKTIGTIIYSGAITALLYIPISVWLLYPHRKPEQGVTVKLSFPVVRILILGLVYLAVYLFFGYFLAWQSADLRAFYSGSTDILPFWSHLGRLLQEDPGFFGLQVIRGVIWASLAFLTGQMIIGKPWEKVIMIALLFSLTGAFLLLLPNPYMPQEVRKVHFVEIVSSNLLFGFIAGWLLFIYSQPRMQD